MELYTQSDREFSDILNQIDQEDFETAHAAILNSLIGRTQKRAKGHYNQWRTVMPFLGSIASYLFTGQPFAPGNKHVSDFNHNPNNSNSITLEQKWDANIKTELVSKIRSLYTFTDAQVSKYDTFVRHMCVIDRNAETTYIVRLKWYHREEADDVAVEVRTFATAPDANHIDIDAIVAKFGELGFNQ